MPNDWFKFKQFTIWQDQCAMKVGTDGVLLGAWVNTGSCQRILDVGTGTGLIALMLAQRSNAIIDAVEIDAKASMQASDNFNASKWSNRLKVYNLPFQKYSGSDDNKYDLIVSNPPYFSNSLKAPDQKRSIARHDDTLTLADLLTYSCPLLGDSGRLGVIVPAEIFLRFKEEAKSKELYPLRLTFVRPTPSSLPKRILCEFSKQKLKERSDELVIEERGRHHYSMNYVKLTKDFYLKM